MPFIMAEILFSSFNTNRVEKRNLKILVISQYFPPDMGGGSARVSNAVKGLMKRGHEITVISGFPHYPLGRIPRSLRYKAMVCCEETGFRLIRVWVPPLPHKGLVRRIVLFGSYMLSSIFPLFIVGDFQVIWAANPNFFSFFPAMLYGLFFRCPVIRNVDDLWPEVLYDMGLINSKFLRKILDFTSMLTYRLSAALTPISPMFASHITRKYKVNPNTIRVIEVGVDTDIFNPGNGSKSGGMSFIVMYSGILGPGYNFDVVLEAAKKLSDTKSIEFIIRGVGELEPYIREKIQIAKLKNVILCAKLLDQKKLVQMLQSADAFILPLSEAADTGLPTKIFEFQALGKPIICCSNGPSANYISRSGSGIVIRSPSAEGLKQAVLKLFEDSKLRAQLGLSGLETVTNYLTCDHIGKRLEKLFKEVLF